MGMTNAVRSNHYIQLIWPYFLSVVLIFSSAKGAAIAQAPTIAPYAQTKVDPVANQLAHEKLALEVEKLKIDNSNNLRNFSTPQGWLNLLYGNVSLITAIFVGAWALYRYLSERTKNRLASEDERFEQVVKSLGSEHDQERVSSAVLLPTFLRAGYERFYVQVFNLAAGNLRVQSPESANGTFNQRAALAPAPQKTPKISDLQESLRRTLISVFREAYPRARDFALRKHKGPTETLVRGQLNAAHVCLDGAYLASADFKHAWMREASLCRTNLRGARLEHTVLERSNISCANLEEAELGGANLKGVDFTGANLASADLSGAGIDDAVFNRANLNKITIKDCTASSTNFTDADLTEAKFFNVAFDSARPANLEAAKVLSGADFIDVTGLTPDQIILCEKKGAKFRSTK